MSRSWADQIEAEDQDQDEGQGHEDQDPGAVEGEVRPTAEVPTTRSSTRMPARAASRTRERTAEGRSPVAGGMQSGAAGGGARVVMTEPIDLWVDPLLRQLLHEQKKVSEMQDTELAAYVLDSKDKMPPRKPFPHDHKDPAVHKKLRWHVGEVIEDLMAFNKLATKAEAKTMRAVSSTFSDDALAVWTACTTAARGVPTNGFGHKSVLFRALEAMLATYTNPNAHYQMETDLAALTWDPKGVGSTKVTWDKFILEYDACVTGTAHLDLPLQVQRFTWKEGWFAVFKTHIPPWASKVIMDKPGDFNTMASFWSTLLRYEPRKLPSRLHALAEVEIETVPWKEAALQALRDGNFRMAQLCMQADGQEEEIPCTTTSYIHAMSQGAPLLARNGKPISCWTCGGNHLRQNCPKISGGGGGCGGGGGGAAYDIRPPEAPTLVHRPGFQSTGPTHVSSIKALTSTEEWRAPFSALSAKVDELLHMGVEASIHQLAQPLTATPFLVAGDTGPDGYIQVGTTTLANGTPTTLWAAEGAMGNA